MADDKLEDLPEEDAPDDAGDDTAAGDEPDAGGGEASPGGGDDFEDLDLEDIDFPDDDFDDDFGEDGEDGDKKKWIIIGSAVFVVVAVLSGGAIFFLGGDGEESAKSDLPEAILSLKIPPKGKMKMKMGRKGIPPPAHKSAGTPTTSQQAGAPKQGNTPAPNSAAGQAASPQVSPQASPQASNSGTPPEASRPRTHAGAGTIVPSVTAAAFKDIPMMQNPKPLPGPDKKLGEAMEGGIVPKVSKDGRQAWQVYAKPFTGSAGLPRIAIIIKGLGFSRAATIAAVNHTPAEVTLAFDPYAKNVGDWVGLARTAGHETLITLPMEPDDFPTSDPGPIALQTDLKQNENIDRLRYVMSVSNGNVGMLQMMGTRFATSQQALTPVLKEIRNRGLLIVDDGLVKNSLIVKIASTIALPRARADVFIDQDPSKLGIMRGLSKLEEFAKKNASAIGIARALPSSITNIMAWTKTLAGKKIVLAPVSAIVKISGSGAGAEAQAGAGQPNAPAPANATSQAPAPPK